jgi:ribosomal protein S26
MFRFVDALFGCTHRHCTFPRTAKKQGAGSTTYVVCLDCGKEFPYDWQQMKVVASAKNKQRAAA